MRWVPLYVLTALVTGLHNFYGLMNMVNGAPINLLNCLSLAGSLALLGAAVLFLLRRGVAAKIGLAGSALSWVFYGPLVVAGLVAPFLSWLDVKTFITFCDYVPLTGMLLGPILLTACTIHSALCLRRVKEWSIRAQAE
ncbi:MAG: hypothetical protein WAL71_09730 [Terriglobales bacterium]|jgi:hypothetical protein